MDLENKFGLMELNISVSGVKIELTEKVNLSTWMEMYTMDFGLTTKLMVLAFTVMLMELCMKVSGEMISNTVKVSKPGQIQVDMKVSMNMVVSTVLEHINGVMEVSTMVTGEKIK
jgi:hypothetical protein